MTEECPVCVKPIRDAICKLLPPKDRAECERLFSEQSNKISPKQFIDWLKSRGVRREEFLRALDES